MALHSVHVAKADPEKFEEYKLIFDGSSLIRHYGDNVYEWMKTALDADEAYIAEDRNGETVGFMWMQIPSMYADQPYLALLGVRNDYRAHGVGQLLIQFFINVYERAGYERGLIAVNDFNPRARILYEDMGFHKFIQYPESLNPGNNVYLLMRKTKKFNSNV